MGAPDEDLPPQKSGKNGSSWARFGRRFIIRLSLKDELQAQLIGEYDRRSELLGRKDLAFLTDCLIAGFHVLSRGANADFANSLALSTNDSNNALTQQIGVTAVPPSAVESIPMPVTPRSEGRSDDQNVAKNTAKLLLSGLMGHAQRKSS